MGRFGCSASLVSFQLYEPVVRMDAQNFRFVLE